MWLILTFSFTVDSIPTFSGKPWCEMKKYCMFCEMKKYCMFWEYAIKLAGLKTWNSRQLLTWNEVQNFYVKVRCHEMNSCWESKHFNQYFLWISWWFPRFFKSFSLPYVIINFLFASLYLLILKMLGEILLRIPFDLPMFSSANLSWAGRIMRKNLLVTAGFWFYRITGGFLKAFSVLKGCYWKNF